MKTLTMIFALLAGSASAAQGTFHHATPAQVSSLIASRCNDRLEEVTPTRVICSAWAPGTLQDTFLHRQVSVIFQIGDDVMVSMITSNASNQPSPLDDELMALRVQSWDQAHSSPTPSPRP